ncbi:lyase family protein [Bartonella grahamii]|uniref:lyase family protein n=1 Tax=Bartonella grahamii TaxID=33045 RepID=UPI002361D9C3|nr:lyase family protein [Bartonella grahamii]
MTTRKKFEAFTPHDALIHFHKNLSARANLFKIANDFKFLGSHPHSGLGKRKGSSIVYMVHEKPHKTLNSRTLLLLIFRIPFNQLKLFAWIVISKSGI